MFFSIFCISLTVTLSASGPMSFNIAHLAAFTFTNKLSGILTASGMPSILSSSP